MVPAQDILDFPEQILFPSSTAIVYHNDKLLSLAPITITFSVLVIFLKAPPVFYFTTKFYFAFQSAIIYIRKDDAP